MRARARAIALGDFAGAPVRLTLRARKSTRDPVDAGTLELGARRLDLNRLPDGRLERLVPQGYAAAPLARWRPFLELAVGLGLL